MDQSAGRSYGAGRIFSPAKPCPAPAMQRGSKVAAHSSVVFAATRGTA